MAENPYREYMVAQGQLFNMLNEYHAEMGKSPETLLELVSWLRKKTGKYYKLYEADAKCV
tara:strand:+ start:2607 stop:2786 length:180 start_codon:yes stop_codon:yes gene_type:complete